MKRNMRPLRVMRKNMKRRKVTDMYQVNTLRKFGQMGKQTQKRHPVMRRVVIM